MLVYRRRFRTSCPRPAVARRRVRISHQVRLRERRSCRSRRRGRRTACSGGPGVRSASPSERVHAAGDADRAAADARPRARDGLGIGSAISIVHDTQLRLRETAVVFGQGVVGLLVTQLLRRAGAGCVLAVDPMEAGAPLPRVGADEALVPGDDLGARIQDLTDGRGADVAVEVSGSTAACSRRLRRWRSRAPSSSPPGTG